MDVAGAQYVALKRVDLQETVDDFKARWVAQAKLDVDQSLVTLRLVPCGPRKPSEAEEAAVAVLDDPRLTLADAGITDGCSLLAFTASSACAVHCACRTYVIHGLPAQARRCPPLRPPVRTCCCAACSARFCSDVAVAQQARGRHCACQATYPHRIWASSGTGTSGQMRIQAAVVKPRTLAFGR